MFALAEEEEFEVVLGHHDLQHGNILRNADGDMIFVDFELAFFFTFRRQIHRANPRGCGYREPLLRVDDGLQPARLAHSASGVASEREAAARLREDLSPGALRKGALRGGGPEALRAGAQARALLEYALVPLGTPAVPD